ncbi:TonB-linked SusC/RagA family outer membrane protein [Tenacibaculum lutimaris]|uniref:TonB-linked SusC/RagA family outer membrane protein n=1 Tax=Tenacibaculum lutimaris TaxID=285258 RepID=A0A420E365_9FLAO|nr:SusC/RagA family TonB-linked outer membrane protein [Tenacibaculum lutimaris]RKF04584.1 TonB-linked SusC/RagA family outer membrane protein [Tenacibaculum lutimaris]
MRTKFNGILTLLLALVVQISFAQDRTISGTVSDETGPLPGVTILKKGTTQGTETDFDGNYSINAKTGDVLVFSFVGMKTAERTVGASNQISVLLEGDNLLDEVVVVGYGTTTRQSYTGTAKVVKTENIAAKSFSNVSQSLAGEVAGVNVINTSGQPGSTATIRIRGFGSVNGNRDPLYVVDGVPFSGSINSINPGDIESTTILKDATATAIYGARGANGVILITTKKGRAGSSSIDVSIKSGVNFSGLPRYDVIKSPEEYIETSWEAMANRGLDINPNADGAAYANTNLFSSRGINAKYNMWNVNSVSDLIDPATGKVRAGVTRKYDPENWGDYGFQTSFRTETNLNMSGGNDDTKYFSSFGYLNDKGYIIGSDYNRYTTRLNLTHKPAKWLTATANIGYAYSKNTTNGQSSDSGSIFWFVDNIPSIYPLYERDANGALINDPYFGGFKHDYGVGRGFGALTNSIADAKYDTNQSKRHELNGNISLNFQIADGLTFENTYGAQYFMIKADNINNPFYGSAEGQGGSIFRRFSEVTSQNFLNLLRYKKQLGNDNLEILLAHETNQYEFDTSTASKENLVNIWGGNESLNNYIITSSPSTGYTNEANIESYFGQVNYSINDKYYFTGSVRRDGSSRFVDNKWGTFGSFGASWILSKENFMASSSFVNFLKLKASYGLIGDQAGVGLYNYQNNYDIGNLNNEISLSVRPIGNPALTWETSKMFQVGTEFTLFNNIIDGSVDYYVKNTDDLIFERRDAPSTGDAILTVNDGQLRNSGLEFDLTSHIIKKDNFKLDFSINGEIANNELIAMPIDPATGEQKVLDIAGSYGRAVGHSIYDFYMREWAGVDPTNGYPLWTQYYHDANNNGSLDAGEGIQSLYEYQTANPNNAVSKTTTSTYDEATEKFIGKSVIPDVRGAFRLSGQIHNFDFSTQFTYSLGGYAYDGAYAALMDNDQVGNNNWHTDIRNRWQNPGDITDVPRLMSNRNPQVNSLSSRFITSTDYLSLNNLRVGYTIPKKFIENSGVSNVNIWMSGDNLFLLSDRKGFNPSTSETGAANTYRYSPLTTITLGVNVKF